MSKKPPKGIDRRPSGLYRVRVSGFPSKSFSRLADAEEYRRTLTVARQTGRIDDVDADLQKLRELASEHMAAEGGSLAANTRATYVALWKAHVLTHHIADMPLRMISPRVVEDFRDDLLARKVGAFSVHKTLALMQTIMERAVTHGRVSFNPVKAAKKPSAKRKTLVRPLSPAQVEKLRAQTTGADAALISLLAYSGMRPGEARALTWGDIRARTITVDKAAEPDGSVKATKTEHNRSVRLLEPLRDDLKAFRKASGNPADSALIFPRADGKAWTYDGYRNWTRRVFQKAATDAGVAIRRPYDLRHAAASLWLREDNPVSVAAWMGHNVSETFKTYSHVIEDLDPADRRKAVDIIRAARQDNHRTKQSVPSRPNGSRRRKRRPRAVAT